MKTTIITLALIFTSILTSCKTSDKEILQSIIDYHTHVESMIENYPDVIDSQDLYLMIDEYDGSCEQLQKIMQEHQRIKDAELNYIRTH